MQCQHERWKMKSFSLFFCSIFRWTVWEILFLFVGGRCWVQGQRTWWDRDLAYDSEWSLARKWEWNSPKSLFLAYVICVFSNGGIANFKCNRSRRKKSEVFRSFHRLITTAPSEILLILSFALCCRPCGPLRCCGVLRRARRDGNGAPNAESCFYWSGFWFVSFKNCLFWCTLLMHACV